MVVFKLYPSYTFISWHSIARRNSHPPFENVSVYKKNELLFIIIYYSMGYNALLSLIILMLKLTQSLAAEAL